MHRHMALPCLLGVLCLGAGGSWAGPAPTPEQIYFHGRIFTADPAHPYAEAVAIRGDRIVAVGNEKEVRRAAGKAAEEIDLKGRTLLPGLIDSHIHAMDGGLSFRAANADGKTMSANELAEFALKEMKKGHGIHGEILVVSGLPSGTWTKLDDLNARFNSGEFINLPVLLKGADEHAGWANLALRQRAGITKEYIRGLSEADPTAIDLVQPYIDPEIFAWQYPARSLLDAGAILAGGSDWTVSSPNVFEAIYQAETRKGPEGVLNEKERMPREAMLYAYTRNAALAMGQLENIGSMAPGKQADFVEVDRDVLTVSAEELKETKVLMTIVGGKTVYQRQP